MFLMVRTRPDLAAAAVSELSRYLEQPSKEHVSAAKRVLCYLVGTSHYKLCLDGTLPLQPVAYADADLGGLKNNHLLSLCFLYHGLLVRRISNNTASGGK